VAIEVADQWQRRGIGTALAEHLVNRARINGLDRLSATTRWENVPARALLRRLGFRARASGSGSGEIELDLALQPLPARSRASGDVPSGEVVPISAKPEVRPGAHAIARLQDPGAARAKRRQAG
jgi:hypothetical protein